MNEAIILFKQLSKYYDQHLGIEHLSFSIEEGEIFGFLGPNGAGKTTTIRLMLDLLKPSSGEVEIFGKKVHEHSVEIRKRIGYLPGSFNPYSKMSGYEFLKFTSRLRKTSSYPYDELIERFELSNKDLSKKIRAYSMGMKQKLGIIQAVMHKPDLIILDEPSAGLDPIMQDALYDLLLQLNKEGSTIFFSSHNLPEVEKICKKVAIVKKGRLVGYESLASLRKMKRKKMMLTFKEMPLEAPKIKGADFLSAKEKIFEYMILDEMAIVLDALSKMDLEDIVLPEPTLEDIFLGFYEKNTEKI